MALLEKHRSVIYAHLVDHVGEEAAEAMLAQFPSRDLDEPVTKEFVALQIAELRAEMHQEIGALRAELHQQTERLMNRIQLMAGLILAALTVLGILLR